MKTAFISGHLDLTEEEFKEHYKPLLENALLEDHLFIVGDAKGADTRVQEYLDAMLDSKEYAIVYHMFDKPRNNVGGFQTAGGFASDNERDAAMTVASDYDIAWVRPGREKSGTAKNIKRRNKT